MYKCEILADSLSPQRDRLTTFKVTYPRIIHAEMCRHRMMSRNTASCLSGDTVITIEKPSSLKKGVRCKHTNMTIKEIVDKWFMGDSRGIDMKMRLKNMNLRCLDETNGTYTTTNITNCFRQGIQDIYEIELENNYKIKCTENHRIFTDIGWKTLKDFNLVVNESGLVHWKKDYAKIATNGFNVTKEWLITEKNKGKTLTEIAKENNIGFKSLSRIAELNKIYFRKKILENETFEYKDKEWLINKIYEGLFSTEIAKLCNSSVNKVKKQILKFGLSGNKYVWTSRKDVWNKGKTYKQKEESLINVRIAAKRRIKKDSYKDYKDFNIKITRFLKEVRVKIMEKYSYKCQLSGVNNNLELHHIVPVWVNKDLAFDINNLLPINKELHRFIHANNLDLEFMKYVNEGKDLNQFIETFKNIKLKISDIQKPKGKGNELVVKYCNITSIKYIGKQETYDLEVKAPFHNFVANGIVVHNSRAIPFEKMVKDVEEDPFIPIAWQASHKGMQGTEYISNEGGRGGDLARIEVGWQSALENAIFQAQWMNDYGLTKQLCNRLLEPFVWTTELITTSEEGLMNFFELRCPQYNIETLIDGDNRVFKSKKDFLKELDYNPIYPDSDLDWLQINKSQAEIHIQKIAEMMFDCYNESTPKQLKSGEWHIPNLGHEWDIYKLKSLLRSGKYDDNNEITPDINEIKLKISTAHCARISYTTLGDNPKIDYEADIKLHDRLLESKHLSCFEHNARAMNSDEYNTFIKGKCEVNPISEEVISPVINQGYCNNFKGFLQYRYLIENK